MTTFVLATANAHKVVEMTAVLSELGIDVLPRPLDVPDVDETEDTLEGNALLKARALCLATGHPAVADDSGLFVAALNGAPGVYSARYAGVGSTDAENTAKLIDALSGVAERAAEFRSVIAVAYPDGTSLCVEGALPGVIIDTPRGENGFGYDPVFVPLSDPQRTLAEHSLEEKNQMSHRAIALRSLGAALRNA